MDHPALTCGPQRGRSSGRVRRWLFFVTFCAAMAANEGISQAEEAAPRVEIRRVEIRHDMKIELPAVGALAAVVVGFRLMRDDLEPSACRLCDSSVPGR